MKTILITGTSSGFGLETAKYFLDRGWKVIATMRAPQKNLFPESDHLRVIPLDVTDAESIKRAVTEAGPIDVLVNNAGIGYLNAAEATEMQKVRAIFETNTFGTMAMVQAVLPTMRSQKSGVIINVTSTVTVMSLPLLSIYTASKSAVNAYTESLAQEVEPFGIRVRLVLPGLAPETKFAENAGGVKANAPEAYAAMTQAVYEGFQNITGPITHARDVAEAIWNAVHDPKLPMRIPAGADAVQLMRETK